MDPIAQVGALVAAIGTMAGFIVWLFKDALRRADDVAIDKGKVCDRQHAVIESLSESNRTMVGLLEKTLEALKRIEVDIAQGGGGGRSGNTGGRR